MFARKGNKESNLAGDGISRLDSISFGAGISDADDITDEDTSVVSIMPNP
jgi:hypothetical protein